MMITGLGTSHYLTSGITTKHQTNFDLSCSSPFDGYEEIEIQKDRIILE